MCGISPEIICAVATPEGTSALSVIRVSGLGSFALLEDVMRLEKNRLQGMRRKVGRIYHGERAVDEVVVYSWPEGRSFTGEEMIEIICHGIPGSINMIMKLLIEKGARKAYPGEFARRAFANGRLNAVQVIELAALWNDNENKYTGETEESCIRLLKEIEKVRESIEGNIEFSEEHDEDKEILPAIERLVSEAVKFRKKAIMIEKNTRIMIMGPANSGKSTLFNLLCGRESALVSNEPGTTRDGSTCIVEINGKRMMLCDTAGTDGKGLDRKASEAVIKRLDGSERVIWMSEGGKVPPYSKVRKRAGEIIEIEAKSDLSERLENDRMIRISSVTGEGIKELKDMISRVPGSMSLSAAAEKIEKCIKDACGSIRSEEFDISAELMMEAEMETRRILGKGENIQLSVERALNNLCVGK